MCSSDLSAIVTSADGGALLRILAGELDGHRGPGISHTPIVITHLTLLPGAQIDIPWREDFNALAYVLSGKGSIGSASHPIQTGQNAVLVEGNVLRIAAHAAQESRSPNLEMFIIGGLPLREPVVQYGPFVMNTRDEIVQAYEDFQTGRFGQIPMHAIQPHRPRGN